MRGAHRWPGQLEFQSTLYQPNHGACFFDVWSKIAPSHYLSDRDNSACCCLASIYRHGPLYSTVSVTRPWNPTRRRMWGFGTPSQSRSTVTATLHLHHIFHHIWPYLLPVEKFRSSQASPPLVFYIRLRYVANYKSIHHLQVHQRSPAPSKLLNHQLAINCGCALLRFNFVYGDFLRWLSGEYTNRHRNWESTFQKFQSRSTRAPSPTQPPADFERAFRIFTEGVPLKGDFTSSYNEVRARNVYNNHPAVSTNSAEVEAKFAKEEAQSFHIALPRVLIYFIP